MCKHKNKVLVNWEYEDGVHTSEYECKKCGEKIWEIDTPMIYEYPPKIVTMKGVQMHQTDYDLIIEKEKIINYNMQK